jgi:hypothetical protein
MQQGRASKNCREVAEINRLVGNKETLRRTEFVFPELRSNPVAALGKPRDDRIWYTFETAGQTCQYICCTVERIQKHCWEEHK